LDKSQILFRSDDYDVTTCAAVTDVDFDGEKEIVLGTFGQELLVYKLIKKYEEVKKSFSDRKEEEEEKTEEKICEEVEKKPGMQILHAYQN
jgi:hypothetical protein